MIIIQLKSDFNLILIRILFHFNRFLIRFHPLDFLILIDYNRQFFSLGDTTLDTDSSEDEHSTDIEPIDYWISTVGLLLPTHTCLSQNFTYHLCVRHLFLCFANADTHLKTYEIPGRRSSNFTFLSPAAPSSHLFQITSASASTDNLTERAVSDPRLPIVNCSWHWWFV